MSARSTFLTDFFHSLSPDARQNITILGLVIAIFWLFPMASGLWRNVLYIGRGLYWKLKKFLKWLFRLATPGRRYGHSRSYGFSQKISRTDLEYLCQSVSQGTYKPWRFDYIVACILWMLGIAIVAGAIYGYKLTRSHYVLSMAMLAVAPLYLGFSNQESGQRRKNGKIVEDKARKSLIKAIPSSWDVLPFRLYNFGDIDVLLRLSDDSLCSIEIKSWRSWSGFSRAFSAIRQATRQKLAARASCAVIWLPLAPRIPPRYHCRILVVCGDASFLVEEIGKRIHCDFHVKFSQKPPEAIRNWLKEMGFRYARESRTWRGRRREGDLENIVCQIEPYGGKVTVTDGGCRT